MIKLIDVGMIEAVFHYQGEVELPISKRFEGHCYRDGTIYGPEEQFQVFLERSHQIGYFDFGKELVRADLISRICRFRGPCKIEVEIED